MADKGPGSTGRSTGKRLARAKIKETDAGVKSSKGRASSNDARSQAEAKKDRKKKLTGIAVGIFAVIMALSMTLPSLSYIFGNNSGSAQQQEEQAETPDGEGEASDAAEATTAATTNVETVDASYTAVVEGLEATLAENPEDLATLLNLGNDYLSWANDASAYATTDAETLHVGELYDKAIEYFDRYLALNDSDAVRVNRALAQFYSGSTSEATAALEQLTADSPDFGLAWANLGMVLEYQGQTDKAKEAYQKAVEADPDDEYGAKTFANRRIAAMAAQQSADGTTADGASALSDALGDSL